MIVVNRERCVGCGLCARICHELCIEIAGNGRAGRPEVDHTLCSTCTQCIAICPKQALAWDRIQAEPYDKDRLPAPDQLLELLKQRRTVRRFRTRPLERKLIEEIAGVGIYAPTNNYDLRAIAVDDPDLMELFDRVIMQYSKRTYNLFFKTSLGFTVFSAISPKVNPKLKVKMQNGLELGTSMPTRPAAILFIVGDDRVLFSEASAQYALYNTILYAQIKGVGSRINAAGPLTLDRNKSVRSALGLARNSHILAMLELGYPAVRFRNKVEGKKMPLQWNGDKR